MAQPQSALRALDQAYLMGIGQGPAPARVPRTRGQTTADILGAASLPMSAVPIAGDLTGLAADAAMYAAYPEERTYGNYAMSALGALPLVPGVAAVRAARGAASPLEGTLGMGVGSKDTPTSADDLAALTAIPPLENSQRTQLGSSTLPSYAKAKELLSNKERILDFGAGRGQGASLIGADTFEPYPREGFSPSFSNVADIPDGSYDGVTSLNVLNVMPREVRDDAVRNIGRVLMQDGEAVITTRGRDVMTSNGVDGPEPMSRITTADTYQKGFTQPELSKYVSSILGDGFTVSNLPQKIGAAGVLVKKMLQSPRPTAADDLAALTAKAPLDTSNIRSVNAAFDPTKRGSSNLLAGAAGATIGLSALRNIQRDEERQPN